MTNFMRKETIKMRSTFAIQLLSKVNRTGVTPCPLLNAMISGINDKYNVFVLPTKPKRKTGQMSLL